MTACGRSTVPTSYCAKRELQQRDKVRPMPRRAERLIRYMLVNWLSTRARLMLRQCIFESHELAPASVFAPAR